MRKRLLGKYLLKEAKEEEWHVAWFPARKGKRQDNVSRGLLPPQSNNEIDEIVSILKLCKLDRPSQKSIKRLFLKRKGWKKDYKFFPEIGDWEFDAYKNGVAVEILGQNIDEIYKDCFKFLLAFKERGVRIGVIIVPYRKYPGKRFDATSVDLILERFSPVLQDYGLWILRVPYQIESGKRQKEMDEEKDI
jgi:hypothetical protein